MAKLDPKPYPVPPFPKGHVGLDAVFKAHDDIFTRLSAASVALPEGEVVGVFLTFPVADGRACYLVTKARPLTLQHVPIVDAYQIPGAHVAGITRREVLSQAASDRRLAALFADRASKRAALPHAQ